MNTDKIDLPEDTAPGGSAVKRLISACGLGAGPLDWPVWEQLDWPVWEPADCGAPTDTSTGPQHASDTDCSPAGPVPRRRYAARSARLQGTE